MTLLSKPHYARHAVRQPKLDRVLKTSRGGHVADSLRKAIVTGELSPGERLYEDQLSKALGVSRSSIREGLMTLEHQGLVMRPASRIVRVTQYTPEDLMEAHELRILLEVRAMKLAHQRMAAGDEQNLRDKIRQMHETGKREQWYEHVLRDFEFHSALWSIAKCPPLQRALEVVFHPLQAFLALIHLDWMKRSDDLENSTAAHHQIVDAAVSGDPRVMESAMATIASLPGSAPQYLADLRARTAISHKNSG